VVEAAEVEEGRQPRPLDSPELLELAPTLGDLLLGGLQRGLVVDLTPVPGGQPLEVDDVGDVLVRVVGVEAEPPSADGLPEIEQRSISPGHLAQFPEATHGPVSAPPEDEWGEDADDGDSAPHGANVAPTARPDGEPGEVSDAGGRDGDDSGMEG